MIEIYEVGLCMSTGIRYLVKDKTSVYVDLGASFMIAGDWNGHSYIDSIHAFLRLPGFRQTESNDKGDGHADAAHKEDHS